MKRLSKIESLRAAFFFIFGGKLAKEKGWHCTCKDTGGILRREG
jgi:hypothetical protein